MSTTIWSGLDSGVIRYDLTYDASRPDPYGTQVNITFHLHVYRRSSSNYFGYQIRWDSMWCNGTNWAGWLVKENSPSTFDFWTDCSCTVYTSNDWIGGVHLIMTSPNNSPSGWYDTGSDINIGVPAMSRIWNDINALNPSGAQDGKSAYFDLYTSENNSWRYNLTNEDNDMNHAKGTWFQVQNIRPYYDYYELDYVTGHDSTPATGAYRKTFDNPNEVLEIKMKYRTYSNTIGHWLWGFKNQEGNNGNKSAYHLSDTSFNATYNTSFTMGTDRKVTIPNGCYLQGSFGTSAISGSYANYDMGTSVTQINNNMGFEYDYYPTNYTITYTMNGGTNNSSNPSSYNVLYGVTFANPSRTGYTFKNWTIGGSAATGINVGANASFSSVDDLYTKCSARTTGNKTVVANWTANIYTVAYNGNGATGGSTANSSHTYDTAKALTSNGFTRIGYTFAGWNTAADGSGTSYSDGASVTNLTATNGATVTLYAQWSLRTPYNLFFDAYPKRDKIKIEAGCTGVNITNVTVYYRANSTGDYSSLNLGTSFEGTISSLQPNTNYQIYVKITNAAGSANSVADEFKTGAYLPANPKITLSNIQPFSVSTTVSATAETNAANSNYKVYYTKKISKDTSDMAVMSLSDGSLWARVFYHNCKEGADLFTSLAQIKSVNTDTKYSKLSSLSNYKFSDGKYEFLLRYPNLSATQYNRWKQTNSPCDEFITTTTAGTGTATGYTAVHIDWTEQYWGGLTRQNSDASTITNTYLSGSVGHVNWYYALGATSSWGIGIPAYLSGQDYANWGSVELWVRINDAAVTTIDLGTSTTKTITGLEEETEYSMWMSVTNVGGTNYSSITNFTTPADQAKIRIKTSDAWKLGKTYLKKDGSWIKAKKVYIKVNGEWKICLNK